MSKEGKQSRKRVSRLPDDMDAVYRIVNNADAKKKKIRTKGGESIGKRNKNKLEPHKLFAKLLPQNNNPIVPSHNWPNPPIRDFIGRNAKQWHPPVKPTCLKGINKKVMVQIEPITQTFIEKISESVIEQRSEASDSIKRHEIFNEAEVEYKSGSHKSLDTKFLLDNIKLLTDEEQTNWDFEVKNDKEIVNENSKENKLMQTYKNCTSKYVAFAPEINDESDTSHNKMEAHKINCAEEMGNSQALTLAVDLFDNRPDINYFNEVVSNDLIGTSRAESKDVYFERKGNNINNYILEEKVQSNDSANEDSEPDNSSVSTVIREDGYNSEQDCVILEEQHGLEFNEAIDNSIGKPLDLDDNIIVLAEAHSSSENGHTAECNVSQVRSQVIQSHNSQNEHFATFNKSFDTENKFNQISNAGQTENTVNLSSINTNINITHSSSLPVENITSENKENISENETSLFVENEQMGEAVIINNDTDKKAIVISDAKMKNVQRSFEMHNQLATKQDKVDHAKNFPSISTSAKGGTHGGAASFECEFEEFGISSSQLQQIEKECNENRGRVCGIAPQRGARPLLEPMLPDASYNQQIQTMPKMEWLQKMKADKQKLRAVIQDITKLNALVTRARREIWPMQQGSSGDGMSNQAHSSIAPTRWPQAARPARK